MEGEIATDDATRKSRATDLPKKNSRGSVVSDRASFQKNQIVQSSGQLNCPQRRGFGGSVREVQGPPLPIGVR